MKILKNRLTEAEFSRVVWSAVPESGTTLADMVKPEYWAHVAKFLKPGARIEIQPEDNSWFAELYVRTVKEQSAVVQVLRAVTFDEAPPAQATDKTGPAYFAKFCGPAAKWRVYRTVDNAVMAEKLDTREQADQWITDNAALA